MQAGFIGGPLDYQIREVGESPRMHFAIPWYRHSSVPAFFDPWDGEVRDCLEVREMQALTGRSHYRTRQVIEIEIVGGMQDEMPVPIHYWLHRWRTGNFREYLIYSLDIRPESGTHTPHVAHLIKSGLKHCRDKTPIFRNGGLET